MQMEPSFPRFSVKLVKYMSVELKHIFNYWLKSLHVPAEK